MGDFVAILWPHFTEKCSGLHWFDKRLLLKKAILPDRAKWMLKPVQPEVHVTYAQLQINRLYMYSMPDVNEGLF